MLAFANDRGDGKLVGVGQRQRQMIEADALGAGNRRPVKLYGGGAPPLSNDLDVAPTHSAYAGAEGLHDRLLGGEPAGELWRPAAAVGDLPRRVYPLQEASAVPVRHALDARYLDYVHTRHQHLFLQNRLTN